LVNEISLFQLCLGLPSDVFSSGEGIIEEGNTSHVTNIDVNFARQHQGKHKAGLKSNSLLSFIELMLNMWQKLPLHVSDRVKPRGVSGFRDKGMLFPIIFYRSNGVSNIYWPVLCDKYFNACVMTLSTSIKKEEFNGNIFVHHCSSRQMNVHSRKRTILLLRYADFKVW